MERPTKNRRSRELIHASSLRSCCLFSSPNLTPISTMERELMHASSIHSCLSEVLLDKEGLQNLIIRNLDHFEVDRIRAVCKDFRNNIPRGSRNRDTISMRLPLRLPCPIISEFWQDNFIPGYFLLTETTMYSVVPLDSKPPLASLLRIEETYSGMRVLHPLLPCKCTHLNPNTLDLLHNSVKEICKVYKMEFVSQSRRTQPLGQANNVKVVKVLVTLNNNSDLVVMALTENNHVGVWNSSDGGWRSVLHGDPLAHDTYDDIAYCRGRFWAVRSDKLVSVDISTLQSNVVIPILPSPEDIQFFANGSRFVMDGVTYLVEVMDHLFRIASVSRDFRDTRVYRLTENPDGSDWERVQPVRLLDQVVVFAGRICSFSVWSTDFVISRPNSIYVGLPHRLSAQEEYSPGCHVGMFSDFDSRFRVWEHQVYGLLLRRLTLLKELRRYAKIFWGEQGSRKPLPKKLNMPRAGTLFEPLVKSLVPFLFLLGEHMFSNGLDCISIPDIDMTLNSRSDLYFSKTQIDLLVQALKVSNMITVVDGKVYMIGV